MARVFNGTTQYGVTATPAGINFSQLTASFWLYVPAYTNPVYGSALVYDQAGGIQQSCFFIFPSTNLGAGIGVVGFSNVASVKYWSDSFAQPSAAAWHHYMYVADRGAPSNALWIDGVAQTLTPAPHDAALYGAFAGGGEFYIGADSTAPGHPQACSIAEVGIYDALWNQRMATALANGASLMSMPQDGISQYFPLLGFDDPEPRWDGPTPLAPPANVQVSWTMVGSPTAGRNPVVLTSTAGRQPG